MRGLLTLLTLLLPNAACSKSNQSNKTDTNSIGLHQSSASCLDRAVDEVRIWMPWSAATAYPRKPLRMPAKKLNNKRLIEV
jgi:hypothetical protein